MLVALTGTFILVFWKNAASPSVHASIHVKCMQAIEGADNPRFGIPSALVGAYQIRRALDLPTQRSQFVARRSSLVDAAAYLHASASEWRYIRALIPEGS